MFDFRDLFIFEMANNHQGRLDHGRRIIREMAQIAKAKGVRAAIKFQFRDLPTFIHPAHQRLASNPTDNKHVRRFIETALTKDDFAWLVEEVRKHDLITMATPFDEPSVDLLVELGIEVVKIGSCSAQDWPLIEKVAEVGKPVVFSTGGLGMKEIDDLVSFFDHKGVQHAIMHCVALYPTPEERFELNQIGALCRRYPDKVIGFSSHEGGADCRPIMIAVAQGARIFEKHVGIDDVDVKLNAYSASPLNVMHWLETHALAKRLCGATVRPESSPEEQAALQDLKRGVYARVNLVTRDVVEPDDVYFAMPCVPGQITAGEWKWYSTTTRSIQRDDAIMRSDIHIEPDPVQQILYTAVHTVKGMLAEAKIALDSNFRLEFSHHMGLVMFPYVGATIIECVNRAYCKKLIVMTPGQRHPAHYHKIKEETFQVLSGELHIVADAHGRTLEPGDMMLIQPGVWHEFWTDTGAIVEEISTTHHNDDSFYADPIIRTKREDRKTIVENWGRFQIAGR